MNPVTVPCAVPGSYIRIEPTRGSDWIITVCEGVDPDNLKAGQVTTVKIYGPGKTSHNDQISTDFMRVLADFYHHNNRDKAQ